MKQKQETVKAWFGSGSPWVWMNAGAVSIAVIMTIGLLFSSFASVSILTASATTPSGSTWPRRALISALCIGPNSFFVKATSGTIKRDSSA